MEVEKEVRMKEEEGEGTEGGGSGVPRRTIYVEEGLPSIKGACTSRAKGPIRFKFCKCRASVSLKFGKG